MGGVSRSVMVNLDPTLLYGNGLSAYDVGNALAATNVVIPSGTAKMGNYEDNVDINMSVRGAGIQQPTGQVLNGVPVFLGDVANVTDSHQPQTNVVRVDGQPATYLMVIKHADASTLAVVDAVKAQACPISWRRLPKG